MKTTVLNLLTAFATLFTAISCIQIGPKGGIGLLLKKSADGTDLRVVQVLEQSPAAEAGIRSDSLILSIDGVATQNKSLEECRNLLQGPVGGQVTLEVADLGRTKTNTVVVTRCKFDTLNTNGLNLVETNKCSSLPPHVLLQDGKYSPKPGYAWISEASDDLSVVWTPNIKHPKFAHILSGEKEGVWRPEPGYAWLSKEDDGDLRVQWVSGKEHPSFPHVHSYTPEGMWIAEPGYQYIQEDSLAVRWVPGTSHPQDRNKVALAKEGEWGVAAEMPSIDRQPLAMPSYRPPAYNPQPFNTPRPYGLPPYVLRQYGGPGWGPTGGTYSPKSDYSHKQSLNRIEYFGSRTIRGTSK